ncbi:MAG TPA: phosphate ABC transporter permease subunit PstC [Baekduia sp.]|nr:phosphate ABC transporter permease subunit PstC [Baekduia sp.]
MGVASPAAPRKQRAGFQQSLRGRIADPLFRLVLTGLAGLVLVILIFFFVFLISKARPALAHEGVIDFVFRNDWSPGTNVFRAWPLLVGTLITAATALVIGVPVAVTTAVFIAEYAPRRLAAALTILTELLAAVPSIVYGLWGALVLIPELLTTQQSLSDRLSFMPFVGGMVAGPSYFLAGLILAIMILPIVCAISREVIQTVPTESKEAAMALGATRWEVVRSVILPYSRAGIVGASMLGMGRAVGETIAVVLVIGNSPMIGHSIFDQGYTLASVIVNEFGEAAGDDLKSGALIAAGLVLFVLTLLINGVARALVMRAERRRFRDNHVVASDGVTL